MNAPSTHKRPRLRLVSPVDLLQWLAQKYAHHERLSVPEVEAFGTTRPQQGCYRCSATRHGPLLDCRLLGVVSCRRPSAYPSRFPQPRFLSASFACACYPGTHPTCVVFSSSLVYAIVIPKHSAVSLLQRFFLTLTGATDPLVSNSRASRSYRYSRWQIQHPTSNSRRRWADILRHSSRSRGAFV